MSVSLLPRWTKLLALCWVIPPHTLSKTSLLFHSVLASFTLHLGSVVTLQTQRANEPKITLPVVNFLLTRSLL